MQIGKAIKRRAKAVAAPCVFLLLTGYFLWSASQGEHGLKAYTLRQEDLAAARAAKQAAEAELQVWQLRVAALRNSHLDLDALDERARAILNLAEPTDIEVPLKRGERTF